MRSCFFVIVQCHEIFNFIYFYFISINFQLIFDCDGTVFGIHNSCKCFLVGLVASASVTFWTSKQLLWGKCCCCLITTWMSSTPCGLSGGLHCPHTFEVSNTARALSWDLLVPSVEQLLCVTRSHCWEFCKVKASSFTQPLEEATGCEIHIWKNTRLWILWVDRIFKCSFLYVL